VKIHSQWVVTAGKQTYRYIKLWKLRQGKDMSVGTEEIQHGNGRAADRDWCKMGVGNTDSKHMKEQREERNWQDGFRWITKKRPRKKKRKIAENEK
jgi:hypothetical protein